MKIITVDIATLIKQGKSVFKRLAKNGQSRAKVDARIIGIKSIRPISDVSWTSIISMLLGLILSFASLLYLTNISQPSTYTTFAEKIALASVIIGYFIMFTGIFSNKKLRSRLFEWAREVANIFK